MRRSWQLYLLVCVPIIGLWIVLLVLDSRIGVDFYPLYFAGQRARAGFSPYGEAATKLLAQNWKAPFAAAGVAYPLPLLLLIIPFTFFSFAFAAGIWIFTGVASVLAALRLRSPWYHLAALPFLFMPFHRSVVMGQATLLWFGLALVLVLAIQAQRPDLVGVASALLILKPQNGLFFALAGLVWAAMAHRRAIWWFIGVSAGLWGLAFLLQPGWLQAWLAQVETYSAIVRPPSLLPFGLVVLLATWKLPWWARVAAAQVVFFPLSDVYSALPLLFCWLAIGGPLALGGASVSWLWSILGLANTVEVFWLLILAPLICAALWQGWAMPRLKPAQVDR